MPYWDLQKVAYKTAPSLGGTSLYDLPKSGFLSGILCRLSAGVVVNAAATIVDWRLLQTLTKLEVILNGTYDAKSITGEVAEAILWYSMGKSSLEYARYVYAGGTAYDFFALLFGRKLFDDEYGLDLGKYDSVELKITNNQSSTFWSAAAAEEVYALILREPVSPPKGFIRSREWRKWTTISDEWQYLDLPTEDLLARAILQAIPPVTNGEETTSWFNMMYDIKYMMRSGAVTMFDADLETLSKLNALDYPYDLIQAGEVELAGGRGIRTGIGRTVGWSGQETRDALTAPTEPLAIKPTPDGCLRVNVRNVDYGHSFLAKGVGPWETAVFNHHRKGDFSDALDLAKEKQVELNIHTRSGAAYAGGTNRVILETLVKY